MAFLTSLTQIYSTFKDRGHRSIFYVTDGKRFVVCYTKLHNLPRSVDPEIGPHGHRKLFVLLSVGPTYICTPVKS